MNAVVELAKTSMQPATSPGRLSGNVTRNSVRHLDAPSAATGNDEGSGSWIARRALQAVARASDGRGRKTSLVEAACEFFNVSKAEDLSTAVYAPNMTNNRIAGFGRHVIEAAKRRDQVARAIVEEAGRELAQAACAVIRKLRMEHERFQVAYVGGVFAAGALMLDPLREEVTALAPRAFLAPPLLAPAEAAARMAGEQVQLALAG